MLFYLRTSLLLTALVAPVCLAESNKVYVIVNNAYHGRIGFDQTPNGEVCITAPLLREWGMRYADVAAMYFSSDGCVMPSALLQRNIKQFFDPYAQLLTLVIPAALVTNKENGVVTSRWDDGINAAFVDYRLNYSHYQGDKYRNRERRRRVNAEINSGVNLGAWRLRYKPVYQEETWDKPAWYTERAFAFRDIRAWRSQLTLGDNNTPSTLFDSVKYRGISLVSDDRMLPDGLRAFSPWVRGYARSNAQVKIRQNGVVIYQTFVSPGTFILKDVYPPAPDGDMEVIIKESDGTETERRIPYSSMPNLVHRYHWKYDATVGKYQPYHGAEQPQPLFGEMSISGGLAYKMTLYGGFLTSDLYRSAAAGVGKSLDEWGALSIDYSYSSAVEPRRKNPDNGGMARLRYAKAVPQWESSFSLLAQYYPPNQSYRTFYQTIVQQKTYSWDWDDGVYTGDFDAEKKYRLEASYNQFITDSDSAYLTLVKDVPRGQEKGETSLELGMSSSWGDLDVTLHAEYNQLSYGKDQAQFGLSFSIPMSAIMLPRVRLNYDHTLIKNGEDIRRLGISGTALKDYSLNYAASTTQTQNKGSSQDLSAGYQYNAGQLRVGYSRGRDYQQQDAALTGSMIASSQGVTLGQSLGETMALVSVPGSPGVGVDNQYGVTTDWRGYAIVGSLTSYRVNRLSLDTYGLQEGWTLPDDENEVVPTAGAIMFSRFAPAEKVSPAGAQTSFPK
jgi:outer membrane usher protein